MTGTDFQRHTGVNETVLAERFAEVPEGGHFVIAETGFGAGLSFLAAWQLWRQSNRASHACLHVIAIEPRPMDRGALSLAIAREPTLAALAPELIEGYPPAVSGTHRLILDQGRVRLTLYFGELKQALKHLEFNADAWFFNGGPADRTPEGQHHQAAPSRAPKGADLPPPGPQSIAVVGAGIAGCLLANNLAQRGFRVTLIDRAEAVADQASGNRQGALYVKLGVDYNDQTELALSSLLFSQRYYRRYEADGWHPTGLVQLAYNAAEIDRQARFLAKNQYPADVLQSVSARQASAIAGIPISHGGLWFPASGWLQPAKLCQKLTTNQPAISHRLGFAVASLEQEGRGWRLTSSRGQSLAVDRVVLCAGADTPQLIPLDGQYRMKRIRGQITEVPERSINGPAVVVCGPGYINPALNGSALVGATFDLHNSCAEATIQSDYENLCMLSELLPGALAGSDPMAMAATTRGRVAFRCTTHDYQPVAGVMRTRESVPLEGIYLFTGLGSKGLTYSPLLAEYLGDLLSDQPRCLPKNLIKRVETQRMHRPPAD